VAGLGFCADGDFLNQGLVQGVDGNLYGTTYSGGVNNGGTVFKFTTSGQLTTLYNFCSQSNCADGAQPYGALVQATNGNFYGITISGGVSSPQLGEGGTLFEITPSGVFTTLHQFCPESGCEDGKFPVGALTQDTNGELYGTTQSGGVGGAGTIFSLSAGLGPFVKTQTTSGTVGSVVRILGSNLTAATSVSFHGSAAAFQVVSPNLIVTKVPTGATSGALRVVTPAGTLSSYPPFHVLP
jgi:uncharacterized repeat protein (TIGR03803 family)